MGRVQLFHLVVHLYECFLAGTWLIHFTVDFRKHLNGKTTECDQTTILRKLYRMVTSLECTVRQPFFYYNHYLAIVNLHIVYKQYQVY